MLCLWNLNTLAPKTATYFRVMVHDDCSQVLGAIFWMFAAWGHCSAIRYHGNILCCVRTLLYFSGVSQCSPGGTLSSFLSPLIKYLSIFAFILGFFFFLLFVKKDRVEQFSAPCSTGQIEREVNFGAKINKETKLLLSSNLCSDIVEYI